MNVRSCAAALKCRGLGWEAVLVMALIAIAAPATPAVAQEVDVEALAVGEALYEIRLTDGSVLFARVTEAGGETIVLVTSGGARLELERSQIREAGDAQARQTSMTRHVSTPPRPSVSGPRSRPPRA